MDGAELAVEGGDVDLKSRLGSFDYAIVGRLILMGVLLAGAIGILRAAKPILRQETETAEDAGQEGVDGASTESIEAAPWSPAFGVGWTTSVVEAGPRPNLGPRSALYSNGNGVVVSAMTQRSDFRFADSPLFDIGPIQGWVIDDPESDVFFIVVSNGSENTTLRMAGLSRDEAIALASVFFADGTYGFLDDPVEGSEATTDHFPDSFGGLDMLGSSQPGLSAEVPSQAWLVRRADAVTANLEVFEGEAEIQIARDEMLVSGATLQPDGRLVTEADDYRVASVGWTLDDGRFAKLYSEQIGLGTLLELVDVS